MLCLESLPFSLVESSGFQKFIKVVCPKYVTPSRTYFSRKLLPKYYEIVKKKVHNVLGNCSLNSIAITTNIWTRGGHDYISVTAHFIDKDIQRNHLVLEVAGFDGPSHAASFVADNLKQAFIKWHIQRKIIAIVSDNAANMKAAIRQLSVEHVGCTAHLLQLVINSGCLNAPAIKEMLHTARGIVTHFKHSVTSLKVLHNYQKSLGQKEKCMVQDEPTRWDSTFHILDRLLEQKDAISDVKHVQLSQEEKSLINQFADEIEGDSNAEDDQPKV
ncbi:unnamed protein product [Brassicogethes aeneus]|uniref:Uncharacterized protein n=1 Tax=Brassicogethes aeneus TaxID=1431903 RepID=A0A9P0BEA9_BRAAE|nr:unnamed protein product [Brassicogethes aeneus]